MKRLFFLLAILSLTGLARADQQLQAAQQALKDQGFYYGDVDGKDGAETDAAIRRYQIREGLDVTGKLDAQTLASLNLGGKSDDNGNALQAVLPPADNSTDAQTPAPAAQDDQPSKDVVQSDHDFLRQQPGNTPAPTPDEDTAPPAQPAQPAEPAEPAEPSQPAEAGPPAQPAQPSYAVPAPLTDYTKFFRKTPYETAPPVVQRGTVQRAQMRLAREGFYRGIVDGELSKSLSRALGDYQHYAQLRVTGRLDMDTLLDMNLLPRARMADGPPDGYGPPPVVVGRPVYQGIWVH
ncbi:MAG: peptidoglycan-binding domain-containing protein [Chthoniobacteraceae bacterium]|jgi:peptidoglycan hydrolase-like protein with peptidoglycan-binding domain